MHLKQGWLGQSRHRRQTVLNPAPDFDPRTFGFRKLSDIIRKTNQFGVKQAKRGPVSIRVKQSSKK
jgi:hypothetical protein